MLAGYAHLKFLPLNKRKEGRNTKGGERNRKRKLSAVRRAAGSSSLLTRLCHILSCTFYVLPLHLFGFFSLFHVSGLHPYLKVAEADLQGRKCSCPLSVASEVHYCRLRVCLCASGCPFVLFYFKIPEKRNWILFLLHIKDNVLGIINNN